MRRAEDIIGQTLPEVLTNAALVEGRQTGFILSGKVFNDGDSIAFEVPATGRAVMISHSMKKTLLNAEGQAPAFYFSRDEIQGDVKISGIDNSLTPEYRILRLMPVLTLKQEGRELYPLTLRGQGASDDGKWGCASGLVSTSIDTQTIFSILNRETGLLIDGQVVILAPPLTTEDSSIVTQINDCALNTKRTLCKRTPELKTAFSQNANPLFLHAHLNLPSKHDTVTFHGGVISGSIECVAFDNPAQRTLTLIFPYVAHIPSTSILTPFNGQGYDVPSMLVTPQTLRKKSGIQLIPGLRELILGR